MKRIILLTALAILGCVVFGLAWLSNSPAIGAIVLIMTVFVLLALLDVTFLYIDDKKCSQ